MSTIKRSIAAVSIALAASAMVGAGAFAGTSRQSAQSRTPHSAGYSSYSDQAAPAEARGVRVVRVQSSQGFDWGDAAVGAAATVALGMILLGTAVLGTTRRRRGGPPATAA